ncbi:MAG: tRNA (guanosine(46)-N7)-methyltransferase TrmB [Bacteroidota bacterium]
MGKNKLKKFAEMAEFKNVIQVSYEIAGQNDHELKGAWNQNFFRNGNPVILELGCGKGEYTVELAGRYPENNYVGIDIKGARMYKGAKTALERKLENVGFLRTNIDNISSFFGRGEVDEIWLTFPDPQMKKARRRLTSTWYMRFYSDIVRPGGILHLKTDSKFMFDYTLAMVKLNRLEIVSVTENLYQSPLLNELLSIKTFYEKQWIDRGIDIKYLAFRLEKRTEWLEPEDRFEKDSYRSFGRSARE